MARMLPLVTLLVSVALASPEVEQATQAVDQLRHADSELNEWTDALMTLATALHEDARHEEALAAAQQALDAASGSADLYVRVAFAHCVLSHAAADREAARAACAAAQAHLEAPGLSLEPETLIELKRAGNHLRKNGEAAAAVRVLEHVVAATVDGDSQLHVDALTALGRAHGKNVDHEAAAAVLDKAVTFHRAHPNLDGMSTALNQLGIVRKHLGDLPEARAATEEALAILTEQHGPESVEAAVVLDGLGGILVAGGRDDLAEPYYRRALAAKMAGTASAVSVAVTRNNLARALSAQMKVGEARIALEANVAIFEDELGATHPYVANSLVNLASLMMEIGDHGRAIRLLERALAIRISLRGQTHPDVAQVHHNLASAYLHVAEPEKALMHSTRALEILEHTVGPRHPFVAMVLEGQSAAFESLGRLDDAVRATEETLAIREASYGADNPDLGPPLLRLSRLAAHDRPTEAAEVGERALSLLQQGRPRGHPEVIDALVNLARVRKQLGDADGARAMLGDALGRSRAYTDLVLGGLSEREALSFMVSERGLMAEWLAQAPDAESAYDAVLHFKGLVGRTISGRARPSSDPEVATARGALIEARKALASAAWSHGGDTPESQAELRALTMERERLERELARLTSQTDGSHAGRAEVSDALPEGSVLIDLVRYEADGPAYAAFLLRKGEPLQRIELGPAAPVDSALAAWRLVLAEHHAMPHRVDARGRRFRQLIWDPLADAIPDGARLVVVPDGALAAAPLAPLPLEDGSYLVEHHTIARLSSATELVRERAEPGTGALIVGDVSYATDSASDIRGTCGGGSLVPLPGTAEEGREVARRFTRAHRREPLTRLTGAAATETAVARGMRGRRLVHLATHGFFADPSRCQSAFAADAELRGTNPLLLSGVVLAPSAEHGDDGILTAEEVASLDLQQTGLVVLSACETGLGDVHSGEGILGLGRAFSEAGAASLVMSLWAVSDTDTSVLMQSLYAHHLGRQGVDVPEALRRAQVEMIRQARREQGAAYPQTWGAFIATGR